MAHELSFSGGKAEMAYTGDVPWHGLGQRLDPDSPVSSWLEAAGMSWTIKRGAVKFLDQHGVTRDFPGQTVLHRSDNNEPLGIVSDGYNQVEPHEILEFFADLVDGKGYKLETAGVLFNGRKFWALARVTADAVVLDPRDKLARFLLLSTSADGSSATEGRETDIRVVCNNTLSAANRAVARAAWSHRQKWDPAQAKRDLRLAGANEMQDSFEAAMQRFRHLAGAAITPRQRDDLTLKLFGLDPWDMTEEGRQKAFALRAPAKIRELSRGSGLLGEDMDGGVGTAWGWLNAVTQFTDHKAQARGQSNRLDSAWFGRGDQRKSRALELALDAI